MADRAVSDLAFEVALREGCERCVNDVYDSQHHQKAGDIFQMTTLFIARTDNNTEEKKQEDQRTKK